MRVAKFLLAAVIVVGLTSTASAVNQVWWEATPSANPGGASVLSQGIGQTLELECALNSARCEWSVTMWLTNDEVLTGWATDLERVEPTIHVKDFQYETWFPPSPPFAGLFYPFEELSQFTSVNGGVHDAGAFTLGNGVPAGSTWPLFSFTLSKDKGASWAPGISTLTTKTSAIEWGGVNPEVWVQFGANASQNAAPFGTTGGPVISINNVPEPATLALLGLGAFCLIRRRR